jgi:hypothetical protein
MKKGIKITTLEAVMEKLERKRYDNKFEMTPQGFRAPNGKYYHSGDLKIIKTYTFSKENSNNLSQLYLIEANDGLIGYNLDTYGIFGNADDELYDSFIRRIPIECRPEDELFQ